MGKVCHLRVAIKKSKILWRGSLPAARGSSARAVPLAGGRLGGGGRAADPGALSALPSAGSVSLCSQAARFPLSPLCSGPTLAHSTHRRALLGPRLPVPVPAPTQDGAAAPAVQPAGGWQAAAVPPPAAAGVTSQAWPALRGSPEEAELQTPHKFTRWRFFSACVAVTASTAVVPSRGKGGLTSKTQA